MHRRLLAGLLVTLAAAPAAAGGFGISEIGVRRTAMGAIIGRPDDASAIYHNPAGLILQDGWNVYASFGVAMVDAAFALEPWERSNDILGVQPNADGYYDAVTPTRAMGVIPMLAVTGAVLPGKLHVGAALYVGNAQGAAFAEKDVTRYHLIDGYVIAPQGVIAASYKVNEALSIGASAGVIHLRIKGERLVYPLISGMDITSIAGTKSRLELEGTGWAPSWMVGVFGRPHPKVTYGATVTGRIDASIEGPVQITYGDDAPVPGDMLIGRQKTKQLLPWAFMGGVNVDVHPNVEIGGEMRYWLYRQYDEQRTDITGIFLVRELVTEKNYRDSIAVSGGVRVHDLAAAPGLELMAGLQYDRTPAPPQTVTLDQPTFSRPSLHGGFRYSVGRYRLGASYLRYFFQIPTIRDSTTFPPSNIRGEGANNIVTVSIEAKL